LRNRRATITFHKAANTILHGAAMNTTPADIRFLKNVLASLILCTLVSGGICLELAGADLSGHIQVAARFSRY
jgi:hypothetical protein